MFKRLRDFVTLYSSLMKDPRTPARSRYLPWIALAYLIFPLDIVPDLLPIIGQTDDLTVIVMLVWLAISAISDGQYDEHRRKKQRDAIDVTPRGR
jgi:uncharacterized membrane protein YkvA (DUF1232 family)